MHQLDIGVGFQQVAPGALARVGLARHQQHLEVVADALDRRHRLVVDRGEFAVHRLGVEFEHALAAVAQAQRNFHRLAGPRQHARHHLAVAPHRHRDRIARPVGLLGFHGKDDVLADQAEPRRLDQHDAAVALRGVSGDQSVERRLEARGGERRRNIVDLAVRHHDHCAEPLAGDIGETRVQRRKQPRAVAALGLAGVRPRVDGPDLDVVEPLQRLVERDVGGFGLGAAVAEILRGAAVQHQCDHVAQGLAPLLDQRGIGERAEQGGKDDRAQDGAPAPQDERGDDEGRRDDGEQPDQPERRERREGEAELPQCPSLSSNSGTWT